MREETLLQKGLSPTKVFTVPCAVSCSKSRQSLPHKKFQYTKGTQPHEAYQNQKALEGHFVHIGRFGGEGRAEVVIHASATTLSTILGLLARATALTATGGIATGSA